ncbi:MAG: hypothetical protein ACMVY4_17230 [Minwuia sp.]|uniref:hypothetical protein n=1 Tax=Minwuia sp. TaxID=2493630 RepID=UPI003A85239F
MPSPLDAPFRLGYRFPMLRTIIVGVAIALPVPALAVSDYRACLGMVETQPELALDQALQWRDLGGGEPARHCAALAYAANGELAAAAIQLDELARDIEAQNPRAAAGIMGQSAAIWVAARKDRLAAEAYAQAIRWERNDARLRLDLAHVLASQKKYKPALREIDFAIELNDLLADAYALKAMVLRRMDRQDESDDALALALALDPEQPQARMEMALAQARGGDKDGARRDLIDIINENPDTDIAENARLYLEELELD